MEGLVQELQDQNQALQDQNQALQDQSQALQDQSQELQQALSQEIQALQDQLALKSVTSTSRKRKREVSWEQVIKQLDGLTIDSKELIETLQQYVRDVDDFLKLTEANQEIICQACGITGWAEKISTQCLSMVRVRISALSN